MKQSPVHVLAVFVLILLVSLFSAGCVSQSASSSAETEPSELSLRYFEEITKIPRPSGNLSAIQEYLIAFAGKNDLICEMDEVGNIRIMHPGSSADLSHIILQSHMDMVPAVREGSSFEFGVDTIETVVKDGWISAKETSLGADDGFGISICLAALVSPELKDCSFDAIFTVDEETNMGGAMGLSPDWLEGDYLLNLDSGVLDEICLSCAGGVDIEAVFTPERASVEDSPVYSLAVSGLLSGHSGLQIDCGRLNAILLAAEFLSTLHDVRIVSYTGGSAKNSIPGTADVVFTASDSDIPALAAAFAREHAVATDPDLQMDITEVPAPESAWTKASTRTFLDLLTSIPDGCLEKNDRGPLASSNLGMVRENEDGTVWMISFVRANEEPKLDQYQNLICDAYASAGCQPTAADRFASWSESPDSFLVSTAQSIYAEQFGSAPTLVSTHGGLECGYMVEDNPDLSIISIGPDIENEHSVEERMNLASFAEFTDYVFALVSVLSAES